MKYLHLAKQHPLAFVLGNKKTPLAEPQNFRLEVLPKGLNINSH